MKNRHLDPSADGERPRSYNVRSFSEALTKFNAQLSPMPPNDCVIIHAIPRRRAQLSAQLCRNDTIVGAVVLSSTTFPYIYTNNKNEMATKKPSGAEQVKLFFDELDSPFKKELETLRKIILSVDKGITEQIKWKAPSFCFNGDDRITFNLSGKGVMRLIFHCGAKVKHHQTKGNILDDKTGLLEWAAKDRAILTFIDKNDIKAKEKDLVWLVKNWIEVAG